MIKISVPARPARTGGCRDPGIRYLGSRQPLHVVTDFPFYGFLRYWNLPRQTIAFPVVTDFPFYGFLQYWNLPRHPVSRVRRRRPGISSETTRNRPGSWHLAWPLSQCKAAQSIIANFCIARELTPEGINQTFGIIFQTHPKTRQNPLREILSYFAKNIHGLFL